METENWVRNKTHITGLILIYISEVHIPIYCKNSSASFNLNTNHSVNLFSNRNANLHIRK